jgi:hypothetical protein
MRSAPRQKKKGRSNTALRAARHDMQVGKSDTWGWVALAITLHCV